MFNININLYFLLNIFINLPNFKFSITNFLVNYYGLIIIFYINIYYILLKKKFFFKQNFFIILFIYFNFKINYYYYNYNPNIGLTNGLSLHHPFILIFSITYIFFFLFFKKMFFKELTLLLLLTLFLGSYWSSQEVLWNDWWNWDGVEQSLLLLIFILFVFIHFQKKFNKKNYKIYIFIYLIHFFLNKTNLFKSIHSFTNSNISKLSYIYIMLFIPPLMVYLKYLKFKGYKILIEILIYRYLLAFIFIYVFFHKNIFFDNLFFKNYIFTIFIYINILLYGIYIIFFKNIIFILIFNIIILFKFLKKQYTLHFNIITILFIFLYFNNFKKKNIYIIQTNYKNIFHKNINNSNILYTLDCYNNILLTLKKKILLFFKKIIFISNKNYLTNIPLSNISVSYYKSLSITYYIVFYLNRRQYNKL